MAGSNDNESQLIEKSLSGDPEAYAMLVDQYRIMIQAVAFRMTGSYQDAEELTQDAFLRGYHELGSATTRGFRTTAPPVRPLPTPGSGADAEAERPRSNAAPGQ